MKTLLIIPALLFSCFVQAQDYPLSQWIKDLGTDDKQQSFRLSNLVAEVKKYDSAGQQKIVRLVEEKVQQQKSKFLQVRFNMFREFALHEFLPRGGDYPLMNELKQSLTIAKELKNEMLLADVCYWYAGIMNDQQKTAEGLFYNLKSIELVEKLARRNSLASATVTIFWANFYTIPVNMNPALSILKKQFIIPPTRLYIPG